MTIRTLLPEAQDLQPDVVRLRRTIHRHPELGLQLPRTQAAVLQALDGLGLRIRTGNRLTSVLATLEGTRPGPAILLRADMDALPVHEETGLDFTSEVAGVMHACGHDATSRCWSAPRASLAAPRHRFWPQAIPSRR
jgi:metal-dependent amidase/aminoacylase/carboxypeptidase family protein